jgi:hypothetical protein
MSNYSDRFIHISEIEQSISDRLMSIKATDDIKNELDLLPITEESERMKEHWKDVPYLQRENLRILNSALVLANQNEPKGIYESDYYSIK